MAVTKRKPARRTAAKATTKRKAAAKPKAKKRVGAAAAAGPPKQKKIAGTIFKHDSCYFTKAAAGKHADTERGKNKAARVLKVGRAYCVYTRAAKR